MHYYVYILKCSDNTYYTGCTNNLNRRLKEHNFSKTRSARYTKSRRPVELIYHESYLTIKKALIRETQIKTWPKSKKQALINNNVKKHPEQSRGKKNN
jgi:putative endonuclease